MSGIIRKTVAPTVRRLKGYLNTLPEIPNTKEVAEQTAVYEDYLDLARQLYEQIHGAVEKLERQNELWANLLITMNKDDQEKEQRVYDAMAEDPDGMLQLMDRASEILINLKTDMNQVEQILQRAKEPSNEKKKSFRSDNELVPSQVSYSISPQVDIKGFDGNLAEWPAFWSRFNCAVHSTSMKAIDKFLRLQSLLKGPAWELVKGFLTTPENYPIVIDLLKDRFGNDEKIQTTLRKQLWLLPTVREGNPTKLLFDIETILQKYETTQGVIDVHHLEDMIIHKLPDSIVDRIIDAKRSTDSWDISILRRVLRDQLSKLEDREFCRAIYDSKIVQDKRTMDNHLSNHGRRSEILRETHKKPLLTMAVQENDKVGSVLSFRPCVFCQGKHFNDSCTVYKSYRKRMEKVKELGLCERCLKKGHSTDKCRSHVKRILRDECLICRRFAVEKFELPPMDLLPENRLRVAAAFENTAIDYAGPFQILKNNSKGKVWICLFTCLCTRAVHLEMVKDLSAATFLLAFQRFTARRGIPKTILSDNGTQFIAASKELGLEWTFIVPRAPWKGGVYERIVGLLKMVLRKSIGHKDFTEEEFYNLIIQAERILNLRPTSEVTSEPMKVLRPVDFLNPRIYPNDTDRKQEKEITCYNLEDNSKKLIQRFERLEQCMNDIWSNWQKYYLQYLRERDVKKHRQGNRIVKREPQVNELVLVYDEKLPKAKWKTARITKLIRNKKGYVTNAVIRMPRMDLKAPVTHLTRSIGQLYPLEIYGPNEYTQSSANIDQYRNPADVDLEQEQSEIASVVSSPHHRRRPWECQKFWMCIDTKSI